MDALPALTGSPKQVAWAETIRARLLAQADADPDMSLTEQAKAKNRRIIHILVQHETDARYWIDHRNESPRMLVYYARSRLIGAGLWPSSPEGEP